MIKSPYVGYHLILYSDLYSSDLQFQIVYKHAHAKEKEGEKQTSHKVAWNAEAHKLDRHIYNMEHMYSILFM